MQQIMVRTSLAEKKTLVRIFCNANIKLGPSFIASNIVTEVILSALYVDMNMPMYALLAVCLHDIIANALIGNQSTFVG